MRTIGWLAAVLFAVGWLASEIPAGSATQPRTPWRRTRDGWQYASWLAPAQPAGPNALHPGLLALVQASFSLWALRAFPTRGDCPNFRGHHARRGRENGTVPLSGAPRHGGQSIRR